MYNYIISFSIWLLTLLTFLLGFFIGHNSVSEKPLSLKLPTFFKKKQPLGAISKLSQEQIEKLGTRRGETEKAMEETLDKIL